MERELILKLADKPLKPEEIADGLSWDAEAMDGMTIHEFLERVYGRGIVNRLDDGRCGIADFHARFDKWTMFEGWKDIPDEIRDQLNDWELAHYKQENRDVIADLKKGTDTRSPSKYRPEYILLPEAEALIDRVERVYLMPCNCRSMIDGCSKPVNTCLRFLKDRGLGWEISKSRAKEIIKEANRKGLMQSGELVVQQDGSKEGAICNCCPDCCFPHRLAHGLGAEKLWPLSRYVADHDVERCTACGLCSKRCPFHAFEMTPSKSKDKQKGQVIYNSDLCRGCGVCSTGCPEGAIQMIRLEGLPKKLSRVDKLLSNS